MALIQVELEFVNAGFSFRRGKTGVPGETLWEQGDNKLSPHSAEIGNRTREECVVTTVPLDIERNMRTNDG